jgi:hypothetical protein
MIKINIPNNNIKERRYILDIMFGELLGLDYKIIEDDIQNWIIELNNRKINIKDTFFSKYPKDLEYLKLENIPQKIEELDIFAASFFMLTRWEEYVNKNRDKHNRFPATESLAYKQGFLDKPIVNEYIEKIKSQLLEIDKNLVFKNREYKLLLTHDVDHIYKWDAVSKIIKHLAGDILKRKSIIEFVKSVFYILQVKLHIKKDPYDTFDYLMDLSEKAGVKSYFFFMAKGLTKYDNRYKSNDIKVINIIKNIKKRGHFIGIHSTYNSYNNVTQLKHEKQELEKGFGIDITFGRGHYLRFETPATWQVWQDSSLEWSSTCGYADSIGFRCGVCYPYSVFNIITRKKLKLKERPLLVMDGSLTQDNTINSESMTRDILNLISKVKRHNGEFVFLWHNSSFNNYYWRNFNHVYKSVLLEN